MLTICQCIFKPSLQVDSFLVNTSMDFAKDLLPCMHQLLPYHTAQLLGFKILLCCLFSSLSPPLSTDVSPVITVLPFVEWLHSYNTRSFQPCLLPSQYTFTVLLSLLVAQQLIYYYYCITAHCEDVPIIYPLTFWFLPISGKNEEKCFKQLSTDFVWNQVFNSL